MQSLSSGNAPSSGTTAIASQDATPKAKVAIPEPSPRVHIALAICSCLLLAFCVFAAPGELKSAIPSLLNPLLLVLIFILLLPAIFWHRRESAERRDAALMLPWAVLIDLLMGQTARTASALAFPLRDAQWRNLDQSLGISIPAIMEWTARYPPLHTVLDQAYLLFTQFLIVAIFLPPLLGKREAAQRFYLTNAVSIVLALPVIVLLPAVGPWVAWHFPPTPLQQICEASIVSLRQGSFHGIVFSGTICLPSYHVLGCNIGARGLPVPLAALSRDTAGGIDRHLHDDHRLALWR